MIGRRRHQEIEPGVRYRLSNGTELRFLSRDCPDGVTNEELIQVLIERIREQNRRSPSKSGSRAITALQGVEEILWRKDVERAQEQDASEA